MSNFWNPYAEIPRAKRRIIGLSAVLSVLVVWTALAASGLMTKNQLPSPLSVVSEPVWQKPQPRRLKIARPATPSAVSEPSALRKGLGEYLSSELT